MKKFILLLFILLLPSHIAAAQETPAPLPPETTQLISLQQTNKQLDAITTKLNSTHVTKEQTSDFLQELTRLQSSLTQDRLYYTAEYESAKRKLAALGDVPETANKEPAAIAKQRKEFSIKADTVKADIAQVDLLMTKIEEINGLILKIRNRQLLNNILVKQSSIFHPQEFWLSLTSFSGFVFDLVKSPFIWYKNLSAERQTTVNNNIISVIITMIAALITGWHLSRKIKRGLGYQNAIERPDYSQKVKAGAWMFVARGLIPAAIFGAFLFWLKNNELINSDSFGILLESTAIYLLYYYLAKAVIKAVFTPYNSKWRIIEMTDERAQSISSALIFSASAICIVSFFQNLADQMNYDTSIIYSLKIFGNAIKAFCIILVARKAFYDSKTLTDEDITEDTQIADLSLSSKLCLFITFMISIAFTLSLFGYIRLSEYIIDRTIISAIVIGGFYIADNLIRGFLHRILRFKFWVFVFRISRRTLVKSEFWFGLILTPIMWIICLLALLAVWGVSVDLLLARVKSFLIGFNIGGIHISITSILLGIISFFVLLSLFRMLKESFINGNLSKIEMNDGVRNSVVSSISFLGFIISGLLAIAVMGGSLSSIAIIAGALSFGVGLGLQNMVSNLAAGLTILWERPIKIGDWVIINGYEGIVRQINIRSTELETFDKSTVIIPNSDILSKSLVNYTYAGKTGRVSVKISVDYDSNIEQVRQTLLDIAASNPDVLFNPEPSVSFTNLGDNNLEFQLNCYTANVFNKSSIANDLRAKIIKNFRKLHLKMPSGKQTFYLEQPKTKKALG